MTFIGIADYCTLPLLFSDLRISPFRVFREKAFGKAAGGAARPGCVEWHRVQEASTLHLTSRRRFLCCGISGLLSGISAGCGTILHPERRGQPAGPLDWRIVGLDALGLLLFFVPGVIAFAVDFNNGTIYLPPNEYGAADQENGEAAGGTDAKLTSVSIPLDRLSHREIGLVVSNHSGRDVRLLPGEYETRPLESIDKFWTTTHEMAMRS